MRRHRHSTNINLLRPLNPIALTHPPTAHDLAQFLSHPPRSTTRDVGGLFLLLSRFNSSCRPNLSRPYWDPATKTITLYALYDIPPNTELVWPYLAQGFEFDSIPSRGGQLRHVFGFDCLCEGCALQGEAREASERRTKELRRLRDARGGEREGSVEVVRRMGVLCGEEGLWEAEGRMKARVAELERVEREE